MNRLNNFGFLRLLFAYFVIISHSPQLIDGNHSREFLATLGVNLSLGSLAVDGFFLISGYLICQSFEHSKDFSSFILKRILRIYPAFVVIWIVSVFIIAPLSMGWEILSTVDIKSWYRMIIKTFILSQPHIDGFMFTDKIKTLNGSLWTIRYEFICYLTIPLIAFIGLNKKNIILATLALLTCYIYSTYLGKDITMAFPIPLSLYFYSRLALAFLVGACFYKFRGNVIWSKKISITCFMLMIICFTNQFLTELGLIIFGSYLLFNFAFNYKNEFIQKVGAKNDISYGVYLYAWPIQGLIIQSNPLINPWILTAITIVITSIAGYISWIVVEQPFLKLKKNVS